MEKIIAVVVMIAIVIGLIATVVLPYVSEMQSEGDQGIQELTNVSGAMNGQYTGAQVKTEIRSSRAKFNLPNDKLMSITVDGQNSAGELKSETASTAEDIQKLLDLIPDKAIFTKTDEKYYSGSIKSVTYKIQNNS